MLLHHLRARLGQAQEMLLSQHPPLLLCALPHRNVLGTRPRSSLLHLYRNCSHRHIRYQSLAPWFEYTPVVFFVAPIGSVFFVFYISTGRRGEAGGSEEGGTGLRGEEGGSDFFERKSGAISSKEQPGTFFVWCVEREDSGISAIKCVW